MIKSNISIYFFHIRKIYVWRIIEWFIPRYQKCSNISIETTILMQISLYPWSRDLLAFVSLIFSSIFGWLIDTCDRLFEIIFMKTGYKDGLSKICRSLKTFTCKIWSQDYIIFKIFFALVISWLLGCIFTTGNNNKIMNLP